MEIVWHRCWDVWDDFCGSFDKTPDDLAGIGFDSSEYYGFYEKVCELDVPVFVHPALVPIGDDLLQDYDLPRVLGREVDLTVATTRLISEESWIFFRS